MQVALVGNRNVGKTTLFNALTGLHQRVGNYPGVTVERLEGTYGGADGRRVRVLDLPGTPSLVPRARDEEIASAVLTGEAAGIERPDLAVVVVDATQVRRGLFLLSQVLETGIPVVVCLNMVDEARAEGLPIDAETLMRALDGLPVVETVGTTGAGLDRLKELIAGGGGRSDPEKLPAVPGVHGLPAPGRDRWRTLREVVTAGDLGEVEAGARWGWVQRVVESLHAGLLQARRERSDRLDRIFLHPVGGPLIFVLVMGVLFQAVFNLATAPADLIDTGIGELAGAVKGALGPGLLADFLGDGVLAGVGAVLVFLPQILILFLFIGLLEDTGYMTRAAVIVDRPLRLVGLSGHSFIPLLSSFACAVPGVMATRTIEDRRERLLTIMVAPLMTCSARLPVYTLLISAFVPDRRVLGFIGLQGLLLLGLYLGGMLLAALASMVLNRVLARRGARAGVLELPPFRRPLLRSVILRLRHRAGAFLRRAGTVILGMSILIWALLSFPRVEPPAGVTGAEADAYVVAHSAAGRLGHIIEPVIRPLGYDWRIGIGLIGSFAAREVFVSTMGVVYAVEARGDELDLPLADAMRRARRDGTKEPVYSLATVCSLLVFYMIALQCVSTLAVVRRETGSLGWTLFQLAWMTGLAWVLAAITYQTLAALGHS